MTDFSADKLRQECGSRVLHNKVHEEARKRDHNDATQSGYDHHVVRVAAEHGARLAILAMAEEREKDHAEINLKAEFIEKTLNDMAGMQEKMDRMREFIELVATPCSEPLNSAVFYPLKADRRHCMGLLREMAAEALGEEKA
jgi:hypothetical protein